jgi:hypothetical protein
VIRELVDECDFNLELSNFQVLAVPEIGNSAAKAAAQADFVTISNLSLILVAMSLVPFVCVALPEQWRLSVLTSGIVLEIFAGAILYFAHSRWQARRRDYYLWLRLIYRRVGDP